MTTPLVQTWRVDFPTTAASATGALALGAVIAVVSPALRWEIVGGIVVAALVFLVIRRRQVGALDIVDPLVTFVLAWAAMFVIRPIATGLSNDWTLRAVYPVDQWIDPALALGLLALVAFCLAYLVAAQMLRAKRGDEMRPFQNSGAGYAVALTAIALGLGATVASYGSPIDSASSYVQLLPALTVPGALLLLSYSSGRHSLQGYLGYLSILIALGSFLLVGARFLILPLLGSAALLWYLRRSKRPGIPVLLLAAALTLLVFSSLEVTRTATRPGVGGLDGLDPVAAVERLSTGSSSEMLPALALEVGTEGSVWSFTPGYWVTSLVTHWVPAQLWVDKPKTSPELLYSRLFPYNYQVSRANTQFSAIGEFYFDSGIPGVLVGMALLGGAAASVYAWFQRHRANGWAHTYYAIFPWVFLLGLRGDLVEMTAIAFFLYAPVALAHAVSPRVVPATVAPDGKIPPGLRRPTSGGGAHLGHLTDRTAVDRS